MSKQQNIEFIIASKRSAFVDDHLKDLSERKLVFQTDSHFKRQPIRPGEARIRSYVANVAEQHKRLDEAGLTSKADDVFMDMGERQAVEEAYAASRIRQTPMMEGSRYEPNLEVWADAADTLKRTNTPMDDPDLKWLKDAGKLAKNAQVSGAFVRLALDETGRPAVIAETKDGGEKVMGHLPDKFLKMNPNLTFPHVGTLQIVDFSEGRMKNVNACVIMDVDPGGDQRDLKTVLDRPEPEEEPVKKEVEEDEDLEPPLSLTAEDLKGLEQGPQLPGLSI